MNSSWLCVDASLVVRLVADPNDQAVLRLWQAWYDSNQSLAAPTLLYYEVTNALFRYQKMGLMSEETTRVAQQAALALPLSLHGGPELHQRALSLAGRLGLSSAYDAHYLAVAEQLKAELWTADRRLLRAVQSNLAWVHAVE